MSKVLTKKIKACVECPYYRYDWDADVAYCSHPQLDKFLDYPETEISKECPLPDQNEDTDETVREQFLSYCFYLASGHDLDGKSRTDRYKYEIRLRGENNDENENEHS